MIFLNLILATQILSFADLSYQGKVTKLFRDSISGKYNVKVDSIERELTLDAGPELRCIEESLRKSTLVVFRFHPKTFKILHCEGRPSRS